MNEKGNRKLRAFTRKPFLVHHMRIVPSFASFCTHVCVVSPITGAFPIGVLHELLDSMEEQEVKEVLLGYWALHKAGPAGLTEKELDEYVEGFLLNEFELRVDFECDDAIRKLAEKKLVVSRGGRWSAVPVQEGLEMLGREWRAAERR